MGSFYPSQSKPKIPDGIRVKFNQILTFDSKVDFTQIYGNLPVFIVNKQMFSADRDPNHELHDHRTTPSTTGPSPFDERWFAEGA